ncbi:hypothetical protein U1Q18_043212 [Sarracenia purpurea var. burkii]
MDPHWNEDDDDFSGNHNDADDVDTIGNQNSNNEDNICDENNNDDEDVVDNTKDVTYDESAYEPDPERYLGTKPLVMAGVLARGIYTQKNILKETVHQLS